MSGNRNLYQQAMKDGHSLAWALKWEAAISRYGAAVAEFPDDAPARNCLATALCRMGRLDEALAHYHSLLALAPDDETVLIRIAEIHQRRGDAKQTSITYLALADRYLRADQKSKAVQAWLKLAEILPDDLDVHEQLYQAVSKAGESALAGKIGLAITRLRGEQASKGIDPLAQRTSAAEDSWPALEALTAAGRPYRADLAALGGQQLELARAHQGAGRTRDALMSYAAAAATFSKAGAGRELAELEHSALALAEQMGVSFVDLVTLDEVGRTVAIDTTLTCRQLLDQGNLLAMIDQSLAGISVLPQYLPLQDLLAEAQARMGAIGDAVARYISLFELYALREERTRAYTMLEKAVALGISERQTWDCLADALLKAGDGNNTASQILSLADEMAGARHVEGAVRLLQRAVEVMPNEPDVWVAWGEALQSTGSAQLALHAYRQALSIDRRHLRAALRLSITAALAGANDAVEEALEVVLESIAEGGEETAKEIVDAYLAAINEHPHNLELCLCCGAAFAKSGNWDVAIPQLERATGGNARIAALARVWLGRYSLQRETVDAAVRQLAFAQRLIGERKPTDRGNWRLVTIEFQRLWGEVCVQRGDLDRASTVFGEVKRVAPRDQAVYTQLAEVHFRRGDQASAASELLALGDLHRSEKRMERALTVYLGAVQVKPDEPAPRERLVETYLSTGRHAEALTAMDGLAEVQAANGQLGAAVAVLRQMIEHCRQSEPVRALSLRERIARLVPDDAEARQQLIAAYLAAGHSDEALVEANQLGLDMLAAERPREAASAFQQVLQVDPWNTDALVSLGDLFERMGENQTAVENYRRALAVDAQNARAAERLAVLVGAESGGE